MKRVAVVLLGVVMLALMPTFGCAQGLFGGLPGLPSFGGFGGGPSGCGGGKLCPSSNLEGYIGYMEDRDGTSINVDTDGPGIYAGLTGIRHKYTNKGVWFGLSDTVCLSDKLSFIASGWYLAPSKSNSREDYTFAGQRVETFEGRTWDVDPQWWYVDGIFAIGSPCSGFTLLAGLRYDYMTVRFKKPTDATDNLGLGIFAPGDTADATSQGWIPLLGTQYACSSSMGNLVLRAVGVPTLVGNIKYKQTIGGLEDRLEAKGTYNNGWFLEVFCEYSKSFGPGAVGIFGRWNGAQGNANLDLSLNPTPGTSASYKLALHRNSWTFGGSFSLNFNMPSLY
jgi:hypothetical protein